jgi:molybdopterin/thiamine biosynthesis adenylyltransferase
MSVLRFPTQTGYDRVANHLSTGTGERFAFLLCEMAQSQDGPALTMVEALLIDDRDVLFATDGWALTDAALDQVMTVAAQSGLALVEAHNHHVGPPRFSFTDRSGLLPFAEYVLATLPGRPYAATVWANDLVYGEWFQLSPDGGVESGVIDRVALAGSTLQQLVSREGDVDVGEEANRQLGVFGQSGQRSINRLQVAVVGLGGTGSHVVQTLAYLGVSDFVLIDHDTIEVTNLNRVVTATGADLGSRKTIAARRTIRMVCPKANVITSNRPIDDSEDTTWLLSGVDLIFGCVDDDGPRFLLNRVAVGHRIPYIDVATGIEIREGVTIEAGGRVAVILPDGPCLACTAELDVNEVRSYFLPNDERQRQRDRGYIANVDEPAASVVSLNGLAVHTAITELVMWIAGVRPPAPRIDINVVGTGHPAGLRINPRRSVTRRKGCVECSPQTQPDPTAVGSLEVGDSGARRS